MAMLNLLKLKGKNGSYIWNTGGRSLENFRSNFHTQRKNLARKLQNPNLTKVTLHTLRHFYACKLYHATKDLLLVKAKLGHRNIQNTLVYTHLVDFDENENYYSATATNVKEAQKLIETGFEYVCEMDSVKLFRKRK